MTMASSSTCTQCISLHEQVRALQSENDALRQQLARLQDRDCDALSDARAHTPPQQCSNLSHKQQHCADDKHAEASSSSIDETYSPLTRAELKRYGRQMLVKELGVERQLKLRRARVLVIGVGGLGSPVAMYLAAMGVGHLGLVDDDRVECSNLHRQVIHDESTLRELKVVSAQQRIAQLNPAVCCDVHATRLTAANALTLVAQYDVVVDASDNVETRYLANDACALARKPLVSGSALGLEGQVTVFALDADADADGTATSGCYRCLYPTPHPSAAAMSCAENGVVGVVPGVIGCLQAMETVKVITGLGEPLVGVQCFYDAYDGQFRRLKLHARRRDDCTACSVSARRAASPLRTEVLTCASSSVSPLTVALPSANCISATGFRTLRSVSAAERRSLYALLDTRTRTQFDMVHFPEALHVPFETLRKWQQQGDLSARVRQCVLASGSPAAARTLVICRRGVDSVTVTQWLVASGVADAADVEGGYEAYAQQADPTFPMY